MLKLFINLTVSSLLLAGVFSTLAADLDTMKKKRLKPQKNLSPNLVLPNKRYPHDTATGCEVGDLRGAVSIKRPL